VTEPLPVPDDVFVPPGIEETSPGDESVSDRVDVTTAFLVVVGVDGHARAVSEIDRAMADINILRPATVEDMRRASHEVVDDINTTLVAETVINSQMQMVKRQMEKEAEAKRLLGGVQGAKRGLHLP
jgi:hypothetical protein